MYTSQALASRILRPHHAVFATVVVEGFADLTTLAGLAPGIVAEWDVRSRRNVVWSGMKREAMARLKGLAGIHLLPSERTLHVLVENRILVRFKKLDDEGVSSNLLTQTQVEYRDQTHIDIQSELFPDHFQALPADIGSLPRVDIGYVPNFDTELSIQRILVSHPYGRRAAWNYPLVRPQAQSRPNISPSIPAPTPSRTTQVVAKKTPNQKKERAAE